LNKTIYSTVVVEKKMSVIKIQSPVRLKPSVITTLKEKLVYVAKGVSKVEFENLEERKPIIVIEYTGDLDKNLLRGKVSDAVRDFARGVIEVEKEILFDRRDVKPINSDPIYEKLMELEWIHEYEVGRISLDGPALRLFNFFEAEFVKLADIYDATPIKFPTLISVKTLKKADYFASFPHHITLATHLVEDIEGIKEFTEKEQNSEGDVDFSGVVNKTEHVCSPAVCFHLYQALEDRTLEKVVAKTAVGSCFRYESTNMNTMARLWDFTMREIIFVGPTDEVDALRQSAMEPVMALVDNLGLKSHIETASDPFFVGNYAGQTFYQLSHKTKYELQLYLPHDGESSLAAGSFNWHQAFFGSKFNITAHDNTESGTACVAFGVERWVYAFISQYGIDQKNWPKYLLENW
jgi:hypothetical protein